jgi:hypothetical protein
MTLSFPGLISAVPLFAVDFSVPEPAVVRCWFSDGGISSNFPIHFFDALWPGRPTFGISLGPYPPDRPRRPVYLRDPSRPTQPRVRDTTTLAGFVGAVFDTMQNWSDEGQSTLPGYRERIVEIHRTEAEGGMNLEMSPATIRSMCLRGHAAAVELDRFDFAQHRWTRYLTAMDQLQRATTDMRAKYDHPPGDYRAVLAHPPPSRRRSPKWRAGATVRTDVLMEFARSTYPDFTADAPKPTPDLRIVAHY